MWIKLLPTVYCTLDLVLDLLVYNVKQHEEELCEKIWNPRDYRIIDV